MCSCWDADKREEVLKNPACDGIVKPMMTLSELKASLLQEWVQTGKTHFRIYKDILSEPQKNANYSWIAQENNGAQKKQAKITINFL